MASTAPKAEGPALPRKLVEEAQRLGVPMAGRSLEQVRQAVREAWNKENGEAIKGWNDWVEKNGLPLERYRAF
jgi:antitoxin CcdA